MRNTSRARRRQAGQILPVAAAGFLVLAAIAGLAIDASRDYLVKRDAQNAVDFAALAAAKEMTLSGNLSAALTSGSNPVIAAHDFAANNGFPTIYNTTCDSASGSGFTTTWFDVSGPTCTATSGFTNKVSVNQPAQALPGAPVPPVCQGSGQYACVQVVITTSVAELFTSVLGVKTVYITVGGAAHAILPGSNINAPWPSALVLYQPQSGCNASQQCFTESKAASRALLSCDATKTAANNCPTFWARTGTSPSIRGYDGSVLTAPSDLTTVQSNGDMLIQSQTTLCDPYGGVTCASNQVRGKNGYAVPGGTKVYCSKYGTGAIFATPCTTTGQSGLAELDSSQAAYISPAYWSPSVDTSGEKNCGGLLLNGGAVTGPCLNVSEPYLIEPGIYTYIVVNHGTYELDQGVYDITGTAPVNTNASGFANGIDHSNETAAADFDLCTTGGATACSSGSSLLTAGVWFGHGSLSYSAYVAPSSGSCAGGSSGANGGGGDQTIISGNSTVFRLEANSGGFVSTHEVSTLNIAGAGVNALNTAGASIGSTGGSPLAIDEENNSFIHIDATPPGGGGGGASTTNQVQGIIYQTSSATAGGVEINLGMNGGSGGGGGGGGTAVIGQVLAYTFTTFGTTAGGALDFSQGYGAGTVPGIQTSGKNETSIISSAALTASATPGYETFTVNYVDEWYMDAYDVFIKVNNGQPVFFSQGIWNPAPGAGIVLPPQTNTPSDNNYGYTSQFGTGAYTVVSTTPTPDFIYAIPNSNSSTIEVSGAWAWGHQNQFPLAGSCWGGFGGGGTPQPGCGSSGYTATVRYTFPIPTGSYVAISVFVNDGDRCGDYANAAYTFKNTGGPGPGQQIIGSVDLAQ